MNLYIYCANNPVIFWDPSGHNPADANPVWENIADEWMFDTDYSTSVSSSKSMRNENSGAVSGGYPIVDIIRGGRSIVGSGHRDAWTFFIIEIGWEQVSFKEDLLRSDGSMVDDTEYFLSIGLNISAATFLPIPSFPICPSNQDFDIYAKDGFIPEDYEEWFESDTFIYTGNIITESRGDNANAVASGSTPALVDYGKSWSYYINVSKIVDRIISEVNRITDTIIDNYSKSGNFYNYD